MDRRRDGENNAAPEPESMPQWMMMEEGEGGK